MIYYQRHLGDYAAEAGYLSALEHGVYTLLLDWYYKNERPIPKEIVYQISKAGRRDEKQATNKVLDCFFLWKPDEGWRHERAEEDLVWMRRVSASNSKAAKKRWESISKRTQSKRNATVLRDDTPNGYEGNANAMRTHSERNANAMLTNNQYPITNTDSVENSSLIPNVGRKGPVPVSDLLKTFGQPDRSRR
jgi:uncharacterized protein YdaU (DUF1376 family)